MASISYTIKRWNGLISGSGTNPQPVVYILPDINLINFATLNNNKLLVSISETGLPYDNQIVTAIFTPSNNALYGCRDNFFKQTGLYTVILNNEWFGQPEGMNLGKITVYNISSSDSNLNSTSNQLNALKKNKSKKKKDNKLWMKIVIPLIIVIIIIIIIYFYRKKRHILSHRVNDENYSTLFEGTEIKLDVPSSIEKEGIWSKFLKIFGINKNQSYSDLTIDDYNPYKSNPRPKYIYTPIT